MARVADLMVIVPTRGRPDNVRRVVEAWCQTDAYEDAVLLFAIDADDPTHSAYNEQASEQALMLTFPQWLPMVDKLNRVATGVAGNHFAIGFAGDDHLARSTGWAKRYVDELEQLGTGIVYGDDGYQHANLCTEWAMTSDIVRALGRMVPAPVEHLYSDSSVLDLGRAAGCIRHLPDVRIEHMHPVAGRSEWDDQYRRVTSRDQYRRDLDAYRRWKRTELRGQAAAVRGLRS